MSSLEQTVSTTKLKLKEKIAYGLGDVGNNFLFDLGQIYLLKFYTDILGLPAIWAGSIFLVSKIFDAFADMSVGIPVGKYTIVVDNNNAFTLFNKGMYMNAPVVV